MNYLDNRQDYYIEPSLNFADFTSLQNIKLQLTAILNKSNTLLTSFNSSETFLETSLAEVLSAQQSLDIIDARLSTIQEALEFIIKTRFETDEPYVGISLVDLSKGNYTSLFYDVDLKGLTFDKQ